MPDFQLHSAWLERQFNGNATDLDGLGAIDVNVAIVTEAALDPDTDSLYSSLTPVATNVGWTGPILLANLTCGLDVSKNLQFNSDLVSEIAQDAGGFNDGRSVVIYQVVAGYVMFSQDYGSAFGNVDLPILIQWLNSIWEGVIT